MLIIGWPSPSFTLCAMDPNVCQRSFQLGPADICQRVSLLPPLDVNRLLGHLTGVEQGQSWWSAWNVDPPVLVSLSILAGLYVIGLQNLRCRTGSRRVVTRWRAVAFGLGLVTVAVALISPVDALSNELGWVHMIQHSLLTIVAAPLMMVGSPGLVFVWAMPVSWRTRGAPLLACRHPRVLRLVSRGLWNPLVVWLLYATGLWLWHLPAWYEAALADQFVHDLEHLTFFATACLFWRIVVDRRRHRRLSPELAVVYLFTTSIHSMLLGVFMTLSPVVWYDSYVGRTESWGLRAIEDQQLAGAIMWMPAGMVFALAAACALANLFTSHDSAWQPVEKGG